MYRELTVGVVIPAYNEKGYVGDVIDAIPNYVDRAYVIDDGSTDGTWQEITQHANRRNKEHDGIFDTLVVPIQHETNRGVGGAIKTGYQRAREEKIGATAVVGGDDQMDTAELSRYLDPLAEGIADYAKGNRFTQPDHWADMPRFRLIGNVLLSYLTKIASGYWQTMDSQNGYSAISLHALETTNIDDMYEYYGYCNDLLVRLNTAGIRVADVPRSSNFAYEDGWKSHIDYKEYVPRVSIMLLRGFGRRLRRKYLLYDYHPLAPLYFLGAMVVSASSFAVVASLIDRSRDGTIEWIERLVAGVLILLYATLLDRDDNLDLQVQATNESKTGTTSEEQHNGDESGEVTKETTSTNSEQSLDAMPTEM